MSRLKVLLRGALISEVQLNPEVEYIGGRKEGSDIRLQAEKGISREHFRLKFSEGHWQVQAVSRFGDIFSMGQKVESANLEHGQSFQIPPYEFNLLDVPESDVPSRVGPTPEYIENERTVIGAVPQVPYIKMVNSSGAVREMLRLEVGDLWAAGRDPSCQIIILDQRVSRRQFEVHKMNGVYTILDLASVNGTFLNGAPVSSTDPQTLKSGDVISVLDNLMYFELHDPNFKYKVDKIEVPPMQFNQAEEEYVDENYQEGVSPDGNQYPVEVPDINQDGNYEQMQQGNGPFTGMPPNGDPNQFYSFEEPAAPVVLTPWKKFLNNKPLVAIAVLIFLGAMYGLSEYMNPVPVVKTLVSNPNDPFSQLTAQQRKEVEENYTLAEQMLTQQKYDLVLEKISKNDKILKGISYKETERIRIEADQSLMTMTQKLNDEKAIKTAEENAAKIAEIIQKCEKLLTPEVTSEQMNDCLGPISLIDATHIDYIRLSSAAEKIVSDRRIKEIEAKNLSTRVGELKDLYAKAEKTQAAGYAFKAMKLYKDVENSSLPDPNKVKAKARSRIAYIEKKVSEKSQKGITEADTFFQEGKLKQAILTLRESLIYDPENQKIKDKIEANTHELKQRMQILYQEAIIDESYGMVDTSPEGKVGAKDKWKKIIDMDINDGEYYKKAVIKLRRYGAM